MEKNTDISTDPPPYSPPAPNQQNESLQFTAGAPPDPTSVPGAYPPPRSHPTLGSPYPPPPTYPPTTGQAPHGQFYGYGQPWPAGYPPQPGYGAAQYGTAPVSGPRPPQYQQQQQQVVVVSASSQHQPVIVQHVESYAGQIVFSCFVLWCCNPLFGLIAFILAVVASSTAVSDPTGARKLGHASTGLSVVGIIISVITVIVISVVVTTAYSSSSSYSSCYNYYGSTVCY